MNRFEGLELIFLLLLVFLFVFLAFIFPVFSFLKINFPYNSVPKIPTTLVAKRIGTTTGLSPVKYLNKIIFGVLIWNSGCINIGLIQAGNRMQD